MAEINLLHSAAKPGLREHISRFPNRMRTELITAWKQIAAVSTEISYLLAVFTLSDTLEKGVFLFSIIPVATCAWLFGLRGGLIGSLVTIAINLGSFSVFGFESGNLVMWKDVGTGALMILAIGVVVGWARDFSGKTRANLRNQKEVEIVLRKLLNLSEFSARRQRRCATLPPRSPARSIWKVFWTGSLLTFKKLLRTI